MKIDIFWDDLTEEKKAEIRELLNMAPEDNGNWDICPMTTMEIEDSAESKMHGNLSFDEWLSALEKFYQDDLGLYFDVEGEYGFLDPKDKYFGINAMDLRRIYEEGCNA